jgi:hypothetical protein
MRPRLCPCLALLLSHSHWPHTSRQQGLQHQGTAAASTAQERSWAHVWTTQAVSLQQHWEQDPGSLLEQGQEQWAGETPMQQVQQWAPWQALRPAGMPHLKYNRYMGPLTLQQDLVVVLTQHAATSCQGRPLRLHHHYLHQQHLH